jgi:diguanylate cyclase (GGDEF)-like protein
LLRINRISIPQGIRPKGPTLDSRCLERMLLILVMTLLSVSTASAEVHRLELERLVQAQIGGVSYQFEGDQALDLDAMMAADRDGAWIPLVGEINFGYREGHIWYRINVHNPLDEALHRYLEIAYPLLDHIEFYQVHDGRLLSSALTGDRLPHGQRPLAHRTFVFPFTLDPAQTHALYLRVSTTGSHQLPLAIWQPQAFYEANEADMTVRGMLYGMLLIMGLFALLLYVTIRDLSSLYIAGVQFVLLVAMASLHGVTFQYLIPNQPGLHERLILVTVPLSVVFFCLFSISFLRLRTHLPSGFQVVRVCAALCALAAVGGLFLPYGLSTRLSVNLIALVCLAILVVGVVMAWHKDRGGRLFVLAWFALLAGTIGHILSLRGELPAALNLNYAMESGAVLASLVLSFALGDRFHREQRARLKALHEREVAEQKIIDNALFHHLTGLPNRAVLEQFLEQQIERLCGQEQSLALIMLHLKGFDDINKTLGHENADELLQLLTQRLNDHVLGLSRRAVISHRRGIDRAVAHVEGITFACVFMPHRKEDLTGIMHALVRGIQQPLSFNDLNLGVGAVAGCALYPDDSQDVATLLRHAFIAFDQAGDDVAHAAIFSPDAGDYSARRITLMTDLQEAIDNNQLELCFQPQIRVDNGQLFGFETLLRWPHPQHGYVSPDEFIPVAERAGLIGALTDWVLDRALAFCKDLDEAGYYVTTAINISAVNLRDPEFANGVAQALKWTGLEPHRLVLEVTETAAMDHPEAALHMLRSLKDIGVRLSIDDFGTGHSSLAYLRKLPVDEIKIDRSFVMEMDRNRDDATIVQTTINMCHDLGYKVVAEGVESGKTLELLRQMGCDVAQGYHIARPQSPARTFEWIDEYSSGTSSG